MTNPALSCTNCPQRSRCTAPCDAVEALLPNESTGELRRLHRRGGAQYALELERRRAHVRLMLDWRQHLTGRPRQVFDLHFNDGLSNIEIGRQVGLARGTVAEYLHRAKATLEGLINARHASHFQEPQAP